MFRRRKARAAQASRLISGNLDDAISTQMHVDSDGLVDVEATFVAFRKEFRKQVRWFPGRGRLLRGVHANLVLMRARQSGRDVVESDSGDEV
ncbi:hypothetical protein [Nocardioides sambongensis]|uniref:hypothetical protein n=1 Tax=Nocardioides sambongensis TaxID=2589074 RepID=UPI00112DE4A8|nr:hypothetical protein [Nocardioides sambongensis]